MKRGSARRRLRRRAAGDEDAVDIHGADVPRDEPGPGLNHGHTPPNACFVISPREVSVTDGLTESAISPAAVKRSDILAQAQRDASADSEGCRVRTSFPAAQIQLWATFAVAPRVFMMRACLLDILAALEVADMVGDEASVAALSKVLACDYVAPLAPPGSTASDADHDLDPTLTQQTDGDGITTSSSASAAQCRRRAADRAYRAVRTANLKAKCVQPCAQPLDTPEVRQDLHDASLWGAEVWTRGIVRAQLQGVRPAEPYHCCRATQAQHAQAQRDRSSACRADQDQDIDHARVKLTGSRTTDTDHVTWAARVRLAVWRGLEILPEHILLRVLQAWGAPLATQLATLPRCTHPAAIAAAHPSVDAARSVSLGELQPLSFRRAVRAVAALARARRIDTVTLMPPNPHLGSSGSDSDFDPRYMPADSAHLQFAARHLRRLSAVTALHLGGMPRAWLGNNDMRGLSCITAMPHLRTVGVLGVKLSLVPAVAACLACMPALRELHLGVRMVPLLDAGGWGGAAVLRHLTVFTTLEAVKLDLRYKPVHSLGAAAATRAATLLHDLEDKHVGFLAVDFNFSGKRPPAPVLDMLRAAAPQLDLARCAVCECGSGSAYALRPAALAALWRGLTSGTGKATRVDLSDVVWSRDVLRSIDLDEDCLLSIPAALLGDVPGLETLRLIVFDETPGPDRDYAPTLGRQLHKLACLTCLDLRSAKLGSPAAQVLLHRLSALTSLQSLQLRDCCMGAGGGVVLAGALPALSALTTLDLGNNDLGQRGAVAVLAALSPAAAAGLTSLDLGWNRIGPSGAAALAARLPEMTSLQDLHLQACRMPGAESVRALRQSLERSRVRLTALTYLDLGRNFLECSGAVELARAFVSLPNVCYLDVRSNAIGVVGGRALARRIAGLGELLIDHNSIGDAGAVAMARVFKEHVCHKDRVSVFLGLADNGIGDAGALALAGAFCSLPLSAKPNIFAMLRQNEISARVYNAAANQEARICRFGGLIKAFRYGHRASDDIMSQDELHHAMAA